MGRYIYYNRRKKWLMPALLIGLAVLVVTGIVLAVVLGGDSGDDITEAGTKTTAPTTTTTTVPTEQFSPMMVVTADGVNVRLGPGTSFGKLGISLNTGDQVMVVAKEGEWYRIDIQGQHYFVHSDYVADPNGSTTSSSATVTETEVTTTTTTKKTDSPTKTTVQKYTDRYIDENGMLQFEPGNNYVQKNSYADGAIPWNLLLVNDWNPMAEGYDETVKMVKVSPSATSQPVDARIKEDLEAMLEAGKAYNIGVQSAYRSASKQKELYQRQVNYYKTIYSDPVVIQSKAGEVVKRPGFSEHNTGLAVDLYGSGDHSLTSSFANTKAYQWLMENCADYGFILRFPKGKESITGVIYEAWHFRYVGDPAIAHEIMDNGLCLEEYLAQTKQ